MELTAFLTLIRAQSPLLFLNELLRIPLEDIAGELNVSQSFLSHVKAGKRPLSSRQKHQLNEMLQTALDVLEAEKETDPLVSDLLSAVLAYGEGL